MQQAVTAVQPSLTRALNYAANTRIISPYAKLSQCAVKLPSIPLQPYDRQCPTRPPVSSTRQFSTSRRCLKKGGKQDNKRTVKDAITTSASAADDPYNFTELEASIQHALERLQNELSKLRGGGRFNTDLIETLKVTVGKAEKETVRLGDLAQVIPRGRMVVVMVGDEDVCTGLFPRRAAA
jgi:ribosome recycling factor